MRPVSFAIPTAAEISEALPPAGEVLCRPRTLEGAASCNRECEVLLPYERLSAHHLWVCGQERMRPPTEAEGRDAVGAVRCLELAERVEALVTSVSADARRSPAWSVLEDAVQRLGGEQLLRKAAVE